MANPENKQIPYESTQKDIRDAIESVATAIGGIAIPSADHVSYDNSGSGLSATDVQNALDEIVSDIPTVNNGTLTIQQNGTSKGSFTANSASNVNVNIETPTADKKTATDQFTTADGGLLSKCQINLVPVQSGSGDPYPTGGGKNKFDGSQVSQSSSYNWDVLWSNENLTVEHKTTYSGGIPTSATMSLASGIYVLSYTATTDVNLDLYINGAFNKVIRSGDTFTISNGDTCYFTFPNSSATTITYSNIQVELGSTATAYAPYSNVRPISGHTEVDLDVKDGDNVTQHTYQVQIGSTVYGGYDEIVGGGGKNTYDYIDLGTIAESSWGRATDHTYNFFYCSVNALPSAPDTSQAEIIGLCSTFKVLRNMTLVDFSDTDWGDNTLTFVLKNQGTQRILIRCDSITTTSALKTLLNGVQLVYKVTTPTDITTTPQEIETLAGQNNLSTPLDGQSIETNGVEYKELFTFADVKEYVDKKIPDAPTTEGTYTLQAVVSGGVPTYLWT